MEESQGWVIIWGHGPLFVPPSALSAFPGPWPFTEGPRLPLHDHLAGDVGLTLSQEVSIPSERRGHGKLPEVDGLDHTTGLGTQCTVYSKCLVFDGLVGQNLAYLSTWECGLLACPRLGTTLDFIAGGWEGPRVPRIHCIWAGS